MFTHLVSVSVSVSQYCVTPLVRISWNTSPMLSILGRAGATLLVVVNELLALYI